MKLGIIIKKLEEFFPLFLEEKWDNSGLILGDKNSEINRVQISLDITDDVINNAIKNKAELIITHHPIIFEGLKKINDSTILGQKILKLIKNGINVYSMHTNLDSAKEGLNDYIVEKLGGKNPKVMSEFLNSVYKMCVHVPDFFLEEALNILNGTKEIEFLGYEKISYFGDMIEKNENFKLEFMGEKEKIYIVFNRLKEKHPNKNPLYELISLENRYKTGAGLGRIYTLEEQVSLEKYVETIKERLKLDFVKIVKSNDKLIKKIAIINGSGAEFWKKACDMGADLYITGDIKYHTAFDAYEKGLNLIDIGHYESEHFFNEIIIKKISDNLTVEVYNEKRILKFL